MLHFFDLHSHMLCDVDDGARTSEEMFAMLEMAYEDGIRALCLTPHYSPYHFGDTKEKSQRSFEVLQAYVAERHPDMQLYLGHELGYYHECLNALDDGSCRCINNSRYVLVDFPASVAFYELSSAVERLQRAGYFVVLAHTERYECLYKNIGWIEDFAENGGIIQLNASSCCQAWGRSTEKQWKKLIKRGLAHVISSDAHNLTKRPPVMSVCMPFLQKRFDDEVIYDLIWGNASRIVADKPIGY